MDLYLIITVGFLSILLTSGIWLYIIKWYKNKVINVTKRELELRMPFTIEEIEAERELTRTTHIHELKLLELQIAELKKKEAEANLKASSALNRIGKLNSRVERLRLELVASRKRSKIEELNDGITAPN